MLLGPIFQVELVSTSRRRRYFLLRVIYGLLILMVLWASYLDAGLIRNSGNNQLSIARASELASSFFTGFSWLQMWAILLVGPAMAVGTISTERERRTIEYLFATDLSNLEIVVGKVIARLLLIGKLMLTGLPILFIFRFMGGIPANAVIAVFLLSASSVLLVTSLATCVSVWSARSRDATLRIYLLIFALFLLPPIMIPFGMMGGTKISFWQTVIQPTVMALLTINPLMALENSLGAGSATGLGLDMRLVLSTVFWQALISVAALAWATFAVRKVHLKESSRGDSKHKRRPLLHLPRWKPSLGKYPMIWKEMFSGTSRTRLGFVGFVAATLILVTLFGMTAFMFIEAVTSTQSFARINFMGYLASMTGLVGTVMLLLLAARAAGLVTGEKERDCWNSLLATPLSGPEIMSGKVCGNLYGMRWALAVLLAMWMFALLFDPLFLFVIVVLTATFVMLAWYVTNVGLLFSLQNKTTLRAMGGTLGFLLFTGGGYLLCCCTVAMGGGEPPEFFLSGCIPFLIVFPIIAYMDWFDGHMGSSIDDELLIAYIFGMMFYLIAAMVSYFVVTGTFESISGRCTAER